MDKEVKHLKSYKIFEYIGLNKDVEELTDYIYDQIEDKENGYRSFVKGASKKFNLSRPVWIKLDRKCDTEGKFQKSSGRYDIILQDKNDIESLQHEVHHLFQYEHGLKNIADRASSNSFEQIFGEEWYNSDKENHLPKIVSKLLYKVDKLETDAKIAEAHSYLKNNDYKTFYDILNLFRSIRDIKIDEKTIYIKNYKYENGKLVTEDNNINYELNKKFRQYFTLIREFYFEGKEEVKTIKWEDLTFWEKYFKKTPHLKIDSDEQIYRTIKKCVRIMNKGGDEMVRRLSKVYNHYLQKPRNGRTYPKNFKLE
jgi:hypothetical protein